MKILQLGKFYPICGGIESTMLSIAEKLNLQKIRCDLLMAGDSGKANQKDIYGGTLFIEPSFCEIASTKISPALFLKLLKIRSEYDIIHIHHPDPMAAISLLFCGFKKRIILHWHCDILKQKFFYFFYRFFEKILLQKAEVIICTTSKYAESSSPLKNFKDKIRIVPIGIDSKAQVNDPKLKEELKKKYQGKRIILSVGRLTHYKGYEYLIRAAEFLPEDYQILIIGAGKLMTDLMKEIGVRNLNGKVKLLGRLSEKKKHTYLGFCDLFCFSSVNKVEAYGIAMIEAMQRSKPVVAVDIPGSGVPWVSQHKETGLNVQPKNSKQLAEACREILETPELYRKYAKNALRRSEKLTSSQMIKKMISIYFCEK